MNISELFVTKRPIAWTMTTDEIRAAISSDQVNELDALREFSHACRSELYGRQG